MINAITLILCMALFGAVCYGIGRLTMALDIRFQQKQAAKQLTEKQARHLA